MVENHARLAGDIARTEKLVAVLQADLERMRDLQGSLASVTRYFDANIAPERLPVLNGWAGRYGKRGALKAAVMAVLEEAHPEPLRTLEIAVRVIDRLGLAIETPKQLTLWMDSSLTKVLRRGVADGSVERLHEAFDTNEMGLWRANRSLKGSCYTEQENGPTEQTVEPL
jgi:hypothetical protein